MRQYTSHDMLKILKREGWYIKHQVGSHIQLAHPKKDLAPGTVKSIFRQAGLPGEE